MPEPLSDEELAFLVSVLDLAREGRTDELIGLVHAGVPVNLTGVTGDSLLMLAAYHEHPDTVVALLEAGADTERVNDRGQTPLGAAVFRRSERSARALLDAGADPHNGGRTAVEIADLRLARHGRAAARSVTGTRDRAGSNLGLLPP